MSGFAPSLFDDTSSLSLFCKSYDLVGWLVGCDNYQAKQASPPQEPAGQYEGENEGAFNDQVIRSTWLAETTTKLLLGRDNCHAITGV
jgi:hypothetical protein